MFSILRPFLFNIDPETAHDLAIKSLKFNYLPSKIFKVENEKMLNIELFGKSFPNPIGFAAPRNGTAPFILNMALSIAARGKMRELRDAGKPIPFGWALDAEGQPTTDPEAGLNGIIQFIGGHKGYGMALAVDILGGCFLVDVS